ncbi:FAD-binding oxidoreductase [Alkalicoccobacillus plakortidis]|uniref:FAD-binding oxidoreductase n=1 Tax=Alkalicoccobacillus plakortidis TaxID=444060 RepID=A0ABT0XLK8_9BACI|nr:FAD-binding oxidoreductase [Alkalicoccobacillus plakortidis]MCM2676198.1 FAD-binding oxidoreductase [Alkalicoccobacillus plakortidis]
MKKKHVASLSLLLALTILIISSSSDQSTENPHLINDVSRLQSVYVQEIVEGKEEQALIDAVLRAKRQDLKVSIAGARHSQGGHAFYEDSVWLNMKGFDQVLSLDEEGKTITVQSGITWEAIQEYINPYALSVKVMQSSNIFTIGGSLSSNVHGRDPRFGPIIDTVESFRLLNGDGVVQHVSREENAELFELAIGGFGLFGVILDVTLELTDNDVYMSKTESITYEEYPAYINNHIKNQEDIGLHFARLSATPGSLFEEMYTTTFYKIDEEDPVYPQGADADELWPLLEEKNIKRDQFFLDLARSYDWGKNAVWYLQQKLYSNTDEVQIITRNNAMRPPVKFLDYESTKDTDILQEYFIPVNEFPTFVEKLNDIVEDEELNLLNATVRFTPEQHEAYLNYAREDTLAIVLLFNHPLSDEGKAHMEQATIQMVEAAIEVDGTYYLTYQTFPEKGQLEQAYPTINTFFERKREFDPEERFMNYFYETYHSGN